jgi:hypothetical protein
MIGVEAGEDGISSNMVLDSDQVSTVARLEVLVVGDAVGFDDTAGEMRDLRPSTVLKIF